MMTDSAGLFNDWVNVTGNSLTNLWDIVLGFIPQLIGSLVIFIVGLIVASLLDKIVERVIFHIKLDSLLKKAEVEGYLERADMKLNSGKFFGRLVYWFVVIASLLAASDNLGFSAFSDFLTQLLTGFVPHVFVAALIMAATLVLANFVRRLVEAAVMGAQIHHAKGVGALTWWSIVVLGFITALSQIGVNTAIIQTLITGLIAMCALAGGLAFGLGGKERAASFLSRWGDQMKR